MSNHQKPKHDFKILRNVEIPVRPKRADEIPTEERLQAEERLHEAEARRRTMEQRWRSSVAKCYDAKTYALIEKAWAAGFWDGEGSAGAGQRASDFNCSVGQVDLINLERFQAAVGGKGKISPPKWSRSKKTRKLQVIYRWSVSNRDDLKSVLKSIGPFLTTAKRDQFSRAISVSIERFSKKTKHYPKGTLALMLSPARHAVRNNGPLYGSSATPCSQAQGSHRSTA